MSRIGRGRSQSILRVLKPGGRVLFSEPGEGHADADTSKTAVEAFGVREEEVLPRELLAACERVGFSGGAPRSRSPTWSRSSASTPRSGRAGSA